MDLKKKGDMLKKMKNFASLAGKLNVLSSAAQQKKQEELEAQNLMNIEIEVANIRFSLHLESL